MCSLVALLCGCAAHTARPTPPASATITSGPSDQTVWPVWIAAIESYPDVQIEREFGIASDCGSPCVIHLHGRAGTALAKFAGDARLDRAITADIDDDKSDGRGQAFIPIDGQAQGNTGILVLKNADGARWSVVGILSGEHLDFQVKPDRLTTLEQLEPPVNGVGACRSSQGIRETDYRISSTTLAVMQIRAYGLPDARRCVPQQIYIFLGGSSGKSVKRTAVTSRVDPTFAASAQFAAWLDRYGTTKVEHATFVSETADGTMIFRVQFVNSDTQATSGASVEGTERWHVVWSDARERWLVDYVERLS